MGSHSKRSRYGLLVIAVILALLVLAGFLWAFARSQPVPRAMTPLTSSAPARIITVNPAPGMPKPHAIVVPIPAGGSLWKLAFQYCGNGADWPALAVRNGIKNPDEIPQGKEITIDCRKGKRPGQ